MPIYEYRCESCGHQQEFLQKVSDPPRTECPKCGKPSLSKLLSAAGFQLKGSGWYATDFKNKGASPAKGDTAKADAPKTDTAKTGDSGGESKAAATAGGCGSSCACH